MTYHVLNGDALVNRFSATKLSGETVIMRECLIEGDLSGDTLEAFYRSRATYLSATYKQVQKNYYDDVASEFEKLIYATSPSEFNLWFGYDLFCQANLWFLLSLLHELRIEKKIFVVYPSHLKGEDIWLDFGGATPDQLIACYYNRITFSQTDLQLANELWQAYKLGDLSTLSQLSKKSPDCFPYLQQVCQAHIDRFSDVEGKGRPEKVIEELLAGARKDFPFVFSAFFKKEGVYGFGDSQVKRIYDKVLQKG